MAEEPRRENVLTVDTSIAEAIALMPGNWVTVGGIVGAVTLVSPAGGDRIAMVTLADFHGSIEVVVPSRLLATFFPERDDVVLAGGRLGRRGQRTVLTAQLIERFELVIPTSGP